MWLLPVLIIGLMIALSIPLGRYMARVLDRDGQLRLNQINQEIEQHKAAVLDLMRKLAAVNSRLGHIEIERKNIAGQQHRLAERRRIVLADLEALESQRMASQEELDRTLQHIGEQQGQLEAKRDEVLGQSEKATRSGLSPEEFYDDAYAAVLRDGYWSGTTWSRRKNGAVYREWRSVRSVKDASGAVTHYVHVFYEVGTPRALAGLAVL